MRINGVTYGKLKTPLKVNGNLLLVLSHTVLQGSLYTSGQVTCIVIIVTTIIIIIIITIIIMITIIIIIIIITIISKNN